MTINKSSIRFYRKKPVIIEAIQFNDNESEIKSFIGDCGEILPYGIVIHTLEGNMVAFKGDYIIKGVDGEFYPCKSDIFKKTYEIIKDENKDKYEASLIAVEFDDNYNFVDILQVGIAHGKEEAGHLMMDEIYRLIEDFEPHNVSIEEGRSKYDNSISIVHCGDSTYHYYLLFNKREEEEKT